jgi:hypothetical protein
MSAGYTPSFITLNLFRVPQRHSVSWVNDLAGQPRYAVTGWLRTKMLDDIQRHHGRAPSLLETNSALLACVMTTFLRLRAHPLANQEHGLAR